MCWSHLCVQLSCAGSQGLRLQKEADGDVTMREGPRRQQQNRCTEQQTASSFCEKKNLLWFWVWTLRCAHSHTLSGAQLKRQDRHDFFFFFFVCFKWQNEVGENLYLFFNIQWCVWSKCRLLQYMLQLSLFWGVTSYRKRRILRSCVC